MKSTNLLHSLLDILPSEYQRATLTRIFIEKSLLNRSLFMKPPSTLNAKYLGQHDLIFALRVIRDCVFGIFIISRETLLRFIARGSLKKQLRIPPIPTAWLYP